MKVYTWGSWGKIRGGEAEWCKVKSKYMAVGANKVIKRRENPLYGGHSLYPLFLFLEKNKIPLKFTQRLVNVGWEGTKILP